MAHKVRTRDESEEIGRTEWARWWLDHGEPADAAAGLRAGDVLTLTPAEFELLSRELRGSTLAVVWDDGSAYVLTPADAAELEAELATAGSGRQMPGRRPATRAPQQSFDEPASAKTAKKR
jgi:hypothetical protein